MTGPDSKAAVVPTDITTDRALTDLARRLHRSRVRTIGFPSATDVDYAPLAPLLTQVINSIGDPGTDALFPLHTKDFERDVITFLADLFHAPPDQRWGYVTTGGTEGNLVALHHARRRHPDGVVYHSSAAHPVDRTSGGISGVVRTAL